MKYYSSILAVFKNESHIIEEWIEHYKSIGIEKIYLLNDLSTDDFLEKIQKHIASGYVTLRNVEEKDDDKTIDWRQRYLYNKYYPEITKKTEWLSILDLDEFLYSPITKNINLILEKYDKSIEQEIIMDWYFFGSSGYDHQPNNVVQSFIKRGEKLAREYNYAYYGYEGSWCCKSFSKTKLLTKLCHHFNFYYYLNNNYYCSYGNYIDNFNINVSNLGEMYINHYLQSKKQYSKKRKRGSCNNANIIRNKNLFNLFNKNEIEDTRLRDQKVN